MKKVLLFVLMALILNLAGSGWAVVFDVDTEAELRNALSTAASNGDHDTIYIAAGVYNTAGSTFSYTPGPPEENYSLTIQGEGIGSTIFDGAGVQILKIDTTGLDNDSNAHIVIRGVTFQNGASETGAGLSINTMNSNITVEDSGFIGNSAGVGGGLIADNWYDGTVILTNNTFSGNSARFVGGGAVASSDGTIILTGNTFIDNSTSGGAGTIDAGGAAVSSDGTVTFINNRFTNNSAEQRGGGVRINSFIRSAIVTLINNTFSGNSALHGGGAYTSCESGTMNIINNTFSGNTAHGGGLYVELWEDRAVANIYNNIIWGNTWTDLYVADNMDVIGSGATVNLYNNDYSDFDIDVGDNLSQGRNINTNPLFVDPATGDFHLGEDSPCIDVGKNSAPKLPAIDFEGDPRIIDGDSDGKRKVDMGADEYGPVKVITPNGGEVIPSGSPYSIQWVATLEAASFNLKYSMDNGGKWKSIASGITDMSYDWTVPTPPNNKKKCLVKVVGYDGSDKKVGADKSDSTFTIEVVKVTWPNGGETLTSGDIPTITWTTHETKRDVARVILKYTQNGGRAWNKIAPLDGNPGSYDGWTVPDVPKTKSKCKVKVVLKDARGNTVGSDTSDSSFTIEPAP